MDPTPASRRRPLRATALVLAPLLLGGCATLFTGTTDRIAFEANVPRVRLSIDGEYVGELPIAVEVSRKAVDGGRFLARFERTGYQPQELQLGREFNLVALMNIPVFVFGFPVDLLSGAIMSFEPTSYHVQMLPDPKALAAPAELTVCRLESR
ncbi:MAG TPA: hypothetical protein VF875_13335 [Anaeromyxobacter sp.]